LDAVVDIVIEDPDSSNYYINGWQKMQQSHREFIVQAAMTCFLSENLTLALLEDCRVVRNLEQLSQIIEEEVVWISRVPHSVWERLGGICSLSAQDLRSRCIRGVHVSAAFAHDRILAPAQELPWRLATGNVQKNLDNLSDGGCPTEPTAAKIWHLLRMGWNRASIEAGVELFLQISWGVGPCEQQHASAALTARHHPGFYPETLQIRSLLHTMRYLLPASSPEEKTQQRLSHQLCKLKKRSPQKVNARHIFVKDLFGMLAKRKKELGAAGLKEARAKVWALHGGRWSMAPLEHRLEFEQAASTYRSDLEDELSQSQTELEEKLRLSKQRQAENAGDEQPPLKLDSCRLSESDFNTYQALMSGGMFDKASVQVLRAKVAEAPAPMATATMTALRSYTLQLGPAHRKQSWLSAVARNRGFFSHCIFVFDTVHGREFFLFVYALQSPVEATFCRIAQVSDTMDVVDLRSDDWQQLAAAANAWTFAADWGAITSWHQLPDVAEDKVSILRESRFLGCDQVVADTDPEPLQAILGLFTEPPRGAAEGLPKVARKPGSAQKDGLVAKYPWMQGVFEEAPPLNRQRMHSEHTAILPELEPKGVEGESDEDTDKPKKANDLADEVLDSIWEEISSARAMVEPGQRDDFRVVVVGGQFSMKNRGVAFQAFRGQARKGGLAEAWCHQYLLQPTSTYSSTWYGVEAAATCAREWCARMQYFFDIYRDAGSAVYKYTAADLSGCPVTDAYRGLVSRVSGAQARRVTSIMDLSPMIW